MSKKNNIFGSATEAIVYPILLLVVMWLVFWADHLFNLVDFYKFGVMPKTVTGLKGIIFMPLIHSYSEIEHIVNNSFPTLILLAAIVYYYRSISLRIFFLSWIFYIYSVAQLNIISTVKKSIHGRGVIVTLCQI